MPFGGAGAQPLATAIGPAARLIPTLLLTMTPLPEPIVALPQSADGLAARLEQWANLNSGSHHLAGLERMAAQLEAACRELTPQVARVPVAPDGRELIRAAVRPEAPIRVLCSGHYDTVYGEDSPFQRCSRADARTLRGPGVADMKGGLVVMLAALAAFEQTAEADRLGWEILLTPDEETGSVVSRPALEEAARRHQLGLVFEPARASGDLVRSRKGTGVFTLTCHGRAAHAGQDPAAGRNAILALAELLLAVQHLPTELPGVLLNIGAVRGGGPVNIVPDLAAADLNARCARSVEGERFVARLRELAAATSAREGFRAEVSGGFDRPPMEPMPRAQPLLEVLTATAAGLGLAPFSWVHAGGGSDANLLQAAGLPCLDGLGPIGGHLHSADEYVVLPSLAERAQLTAALLHRLATGQVVLES